jgi:hypothetical protein
LNQIIEEHLTDGRRGKNTQLPLPDLLRQSIYSRLAGYEDVNDAERLSQDPTFRLIGSEKIWHPGAALPSRLHWFETEVLSQDENLEGLSRINRELLAKAEAMDSPQRVRRSGHGLQGADGTVRLACTDSTHDRDYQRWRRQLQPPERDEAIPEALESGAVIFTVNTDLSGMSYRGAKNMEALAEATGGESFSQVGVKEISQVFENISKAIDEMLLSAVFPARPLRERGSSDRSEDWA